MSDFFGCKDTKNMFYNMFLEEKKFKKEYIFYIKRGYKYFFFMYSAQIRAASSTICEQGRLA